MTRPYPLFPDPGDGVPRARSRNLRLHPIRRPQRRGAAPFAIGQARRSADGYHHTWTLYDGMGRPVQAQEEAGDGLLVVTHQAYDGLAGCPSLAADDGHDNRRHLHHADLGAHPLP